MSSTELNAVLRNDLRAFTEKAFETINEGRPFLDNWHLGAITHQLMNVYRGDVRRLLVTQPPRSLKSICTSVAFVAWGLGKDPTLRIICISYSQDMALELSYQCRQVMESDWYKQVFPRTKLRRVRDIELKTTKNGGRFTTSIGGVLTGRGGDIVIIDDPLKAEDANSEAARARVLNWYRSSLATRHDDPKKGRIIITMQRLHEEDLAGFVIERGGYERLNLPAIAEEDATIPIGQNRFHHRKAGDLLHPERQGVPELDQLKRDLGSQMFSAQYMQQPVPAEGLIFQRSWFQHYRQQPDKTVGVQIIQSWDTALSIGGTADFSVCVTALRVKAQIYIIDVFRARLNHPDLRRKVIEHAKSFGANVVLLEKAGAGKALFDDLRMSSTPGMPTPTGIQPDTDKQSRAANASVIVERGDVYLPNDAPWLGDFLNEVLGFPSVRYDDQVDAFTQLVNWADKRWKQTHLTGGIGDLGIVPAGQIVQIQDYDAWPRDEDASVWE